jgi:structural maintenance of chromosome 3 (chondroitin sulfate proteoglycan 6)
MMKKLDVCNKALKKFSHVNKKAYDRYVNFRKQRESLLSRKKVTELINSLDKQKDEAGDGTFRGVSMHFKEVFKELVPDGAEDWRWRGRGQ